VAEAAQSAMNGVWNVPRRRYPNFLLRRRRGLAKQEERLPDQRVEVSFGDTDDGAGRLDQSS
jgi:hypothetical protein